MSRLPARKRALDLALGVPALITTGTILATSAVAQKMLGDDGPLLYRSRRVGCDGREFKVLKIRTMAVSGDGPAITVSEDRRITPSGRFLRRFRIDEVPQVINVVRGEMSLVGPRPEDPRFVDWSDPLHRKVFSATPGITGLTQLRFVDEAELLSGPDPEATYRTEILPRKLAIDAEYLDDWSMRLDLRILVETVLTVIRGRRGGESTR